MCSLDFFKISKCFFPEFALCKNHVFEKEKNIKFGKIKLAVIYGGVILDKNILYPPFFFVYCSIIAFDSLNICIYEFWDPDLKNIYISGLNWVMIN